MRSTLLFALLSACSLPIAQPTLEASVIEASCYEQPAGVIAFIPQQATNWCWAAVSNMVASAYGDVARQCELASIVTGRSDCCEKGANSTPECDVQAAPLNVLRDVYDLSATEIDRPVTEDELRAELDAGRSVVVTYRTDTVTHITVVTGIEDERYTLLDPANGTYRWTYEQLLTRTTAGRQWQWHHSITAIHPDGC